MLEGELSNLNKESLIGEKRIHLQLSDPAKV